MIAYLTNYLPWRRFPLLGTWEVDVVATEERLEQQLPDKSKIQSRLLSVSGDRWVFTRSYSRRKFSDPVGGEPKIETRHRYWWKARDDGDLYICEARKDGNALLFKVELTDENRFEFFEPARGHTVVWIRA